MIRLGLHLGCAPEGGGTFQYAQSVLRAMLNLPADRFELIVTHTHPAWSEALAAYGTQLRGIPVRRGFFDKLGRFCMRLGMPGWVWRIAASSLPSLERRLTQLACDWWIFPSQDFLAGTVRARCVGTVHDLMHRYEPQFPEVGAPSIVHQRERLYRTMCRYAHAVLVDSKCGRQQVVESYDVSSTQVHVLPFAAPAYLSGSQTPADFDVRFHLPETYIFYPAQMWPHKNHLRLIKALFEARKTLPNLHLVLAGSNKNGTESIHQLVRELALDGAVHFLGYVPDEYMAELYRRTRCLMMPSFFGPTNIPPLEAMVMGCPMALADVYAMREQSGDCALYFDPESVAEMANCMHTLVTDEATRARLVAACAKRRDHFTQAAFNERFRMIVQKVTGTAPQVTTQGQCK